MYPKSPFRYPLKSVSVPRKSVLVSTKVRFGPFRSVSVRSGPFRSVPVSTKVRFGTQKVRSGIHESPFRSVPVRSGPSRSVPVSRDSGSSSSSSFKSEWKKTLNESVHSHIEASWRADLSVKTS